MPATALTDLHVARVGRYMAQTNGDRVALDDGDTRLTYAELDRQLDAVAGALRRLGVGHGDVVCAYLPNCIEYVLTVIAVARAGGIFSPLNPRFRCGELKPILQQAKPGGRHRRCRPAGTAPAGAARARSGQPDRPARGCARGGMAALGRVVECAAAGARIAQRAGSFQPVVHVGYDRGARRARWPRIARGCCGCCTAAFCTGCPTRTSMWHHAVGALRRADLSR